MVTKTRLVYTAGTFAIPDDLARARRLVVRSSVLRLPPTTNYTNERSNPPKYFLGYASIFINDYVVKVMPIEYEQQVLLLWDNLPSQVYARMLCEFVNSNANLVALRTSIPLAGALVPVPGDPGTFSGCPFTIIKLKLLFGTRLLITGEGEPLETCEGAPFETTVPTFDPPPAPYPDDQARSEDPARSDPEPTEKPGDTAPATIDDPDQGLLPPVPPTIRAIYAIGAANGQPGQPNVSVDYTVPDLTYTIVLVAGTAPGFCPGQQPQRSVARSPGNADILLVDHNTCNALSIISQSFI